MKIRQAPVADLLKYIGELYANRNHNKQKSIFDVINNYYCSLSKHKTIMPVAGDYFNDWCDLNWSPTMKNCPNIPGIIIYKDNPNGTRKYGLIYHSGYIISEPLQTNYMSFYEIDNNGRVSSHVYCKDDWDGWGAPIRFFSFPPEDYVDSSTWTLGERVLSKDVFGHDVRQLQALLHRAHEEVPLHGYFEDQTLKALHLTQYWCNIPQTNSFNLNSVEGKKIIEYLTNGNKD